MRVTAQNITSKPPPVHATASAVDAGKPSIIAPLPVANLAASACTSGVTTNAGCSGVAAQISSARRSVNTSLRFDLQDMRTIRRGIQQAPLLDRPLGRLAPHHPPLAVRRSIDVTRSQFSTLVAFEQNQRRDK